ncbi:hypothetical protein NQ315_005108 [Exocentrus adspersus]|uniref:Tyr recombinase domain-containing protein n=1 Tax=Exocentrus adspersus TaxID=1586481 RepID=A0AAV8VUV6_9CUCU|nr:hypothetical protein NQ315_005108 [Exocentrus adspersus]
MNQKCPSQPVGINTLAKVPSIVASFLNLPNAELYAGHCMRRTSTTLLANKGADLTTIKRHGGWKSSAVVESYIEDSISNKLDIARKVQGEFNITRSENDGNNPTRVVINGKEVACEKTKNEMCITINVNVNVNNGIKFFIPLVDFQDSPTARPRILSTRPQKQYFPDLLRK